MVNNFFKSIFAVATILGVALGFVACETEGDGVVTDPHVEVSETSLNFTNQEGDQAVEITSNADWKIEVNNADWITVTPSNGRGDKTVRVAVAANTTGTLREAIVKVIAVHSVYGNWDTKKITVKQSSTDAPTVEETLLYSDNFDGVVATQTYGSGTSWPYIDQFTDFANPEGPASDNVTYTGSGVSIRANSTSDSNYSDYEGSGSNNIFFGSSAYFQINNIALNATQNSYKMTFGSEKYLKDGDGNFSTEEFKVFISKNGTAWSQIAIEYAGTEPGRWNVATANFTLTEVPQHLFVKFTASVASAYRLDDVKFYTGNGGQQVTLTDEGGNIPAPDAKVVTVDEFLKAAEDATIYQLTGEITRVANTTYGNFDITDSTGTVYVYGLLTPNGEAQKQWAAAGLKQGDTITIYGTRSSFNDTPQMKNATYVSHTPGEGGGNTPAPSAGIYTSDAAFVCATDDNTNAAYGLGETVIAGSSVTGFKLGKSKQAGKFTSAAVGVTGDKYLNLYAVAWNGSSDVKLYYRVNGGATQSFALTANIGASNIPPYSSLSFAATDHYSVKLTGLTATSTIEFSTDEKFELTTYSGDAPRAIVCGVKLSDTPIEGEDVSAPEPGETKKVTVKEFLAAAEDATTMYELTGTIDRMYQNSENDTLYGNFYLKDSTGEVLIYGLMDKDGNKYWATSGVKIGDTITVRTIRTSFNGTPQGKNATYVSHTSGSGDNTGGDNTGGDQTPVDPANATVAQFLAAAEDDTVYTLKGTITAVTNTEYGNFDLTDDTGTVLIYGLCSPEGEAKYWATSGAKVGDDIVVNTVRTSYNNAPQGKNAIFVDLTSPGTRAFWSFEKTSTTFGAAGGEQTISVSAYNLKGSVTAKSDNNQFSATYSSGKLTIKALQNTSANTIKGNITVTSGALEQVITVAQGGVSVGGGTEVVAEAKMKDFGWVNEEKVSEAKIDDNVTVKFFKGGASTDPAYYTSGEAVRLYQNGGYMTVSANGKTIKSMEITFANNMYYVAADSGELTAEAATRTWTGDATEVKITCTGTDKSHRAYIAAIKVTYIK